MARDGTKPGTPEREAADREYEAAFAAFRSIAAQIKYRKKPRLAKSGGGADPPRRSFLGSVVGGSSDTAAPAA